MPYGIFERKDTRAAGIAIGNFILDLKSCAERDLLTGLDANVVEACREEVLNSLMSLGPAHWTALRARVVDLLKEHSPEQVRVAPFLVPQSEAAMCMPVKIGDYTDFFSSIHHATNAGRLFSPDRPLPPNYRYLPIGYHGRASSVVLSGTTVRRPRGQFKDVADPTPHFAPTNALDYELELGVFIGTGNVLGEPIPIEQAESHIFGLCLLNDWSARDIQFWESQPLGPFLAKSFATTISPWIVPLEAFQPFRIRAAERPAGDPAPLDYLNSTRDQECGGIDLELEVHLVSQKMRDAGIPPMLVSRSNFRDQYWTIAQLVAHHTSNGCNLRPGDLLGSGTVSGPSDGSRGCLLEITEGGKKAIQLPTGEERTFLEDGDEVILRGACTRDELRIGLSECRGTISVNRRGR